MSIIGNAILLGGGGGGGGSVIVWDETDAAGGTIRHIESSDVYGLENGSATPTTSQQVVNPTSGKYFAKFTVGAIPSGYIIPAGTKSISSNGSNIDVAEYAAVNVSVPTGTARSSSDLTASGDTVTVPAGLYSTNASKAVASGTAGTPTASKGTVNNHSISVTPSVTNTAGYISGGTKTGTAVTVSASELVSGSETKTSNGTYDVTNLASLVVNVSGGGSSKNVQYVLGSAYAKNNGYTSTGMSITVAKAGTYKVSWAGWRSSSQGTMGTNLYKNGTAGTNQQTFTSTYGQSITLENQSYSQGDVLTLYATSGSTSRYMYVANLIIEEQ